MAHRRVEDAKVDQGIQLAAFYGSIVVGLFHGYPAVGVYLACEIRGWQFHRESANSYCELDVGKCYDRFGLNLGIGRCDFDAGVNRNRLAAQHRQWRGLRSRLLPAN